MKQSCNDLSYSRILRNVIIIHKKIYAGGVHTSSPLRKLGDDNLERNSACMNGYDCIAAWKQENKTCREVIYFWCRETQLRFHLCNVFNCNILTPHVPQLRNKSRLKPESAWAMLLPSGAYWTTLIVWGWWLESLLVLGWILKVFQDFTLFYFFKGKYCISETFHNPILGLKKWFNTNLITTY